MSMTILSKLLTSLKEGTLPAKLKNRFLIKVSKFRNKFLYIQLSFISGFLRKKFPVLKKEYTKRELIAVFSHRSMPDLFINFLFNTGFARSFINQSCSDKNSDPFPWMTLVMKSFCYSFALL